jgi:hypothetical protein
MSKVVPSPRLFFWLALLTALVLLSLLLIAPLLDSADPLLRLFARDPMVRRTALASALALLVTAWTFFRPAPAAAKPERPIPPPVIGA